MSTAKKATMLGIGMDLWASAKSAGTWVGGALKGEFNNKATIGQIVFDAVISMFPVTGEVTAIRDLVAIVMRISGDTREAQKVLNWISIVLCLLPIIPVFGGLLKGIGRLLVTIIKDATKTKEITAAILAYLKKMGHGDPKNYLSTLSFSKYQSRILTEFKKFIYRFKSALGFVHRRMGSVLPNNVNVFISSMGPELDSLAKLADKMIPSAIKELDRALNQVRSEMIKQMNHAGTKIGGGKNKVTTHEARLTTTAVKTIASKGHKPAPLSHYKHKKGWPNLSDKKDTKVPENSILKFYVIASFSRDAAIAPKLYTPGTKVNWKRVLDKSRPAKSGGYWADKMPKDGKSWRLDYAVKSAWSKNGVYVELPYIPTAKEMQRLGIHVPNGWQGMKVWEGKVAEQDDWDEKLKVGSKLLLPGGEKQIYIEFSHPDNKPVKEYIDKILQIKATHWSDAIFPQDQNTIVAYLANRELSKKTVQQGQVARSASTIERANARNH